MLFLLSPNMRPLILPPELWLQAISYLPEQQYKRRLCALSTQSRQLRALCAPHIFGDFTAWINYKGRTLDAEASLRRRTLWDVQALLFCNTQILKSVCCLRICMVTEDEASWVKSAPY